MKKPSFWRVLVAYLVDITLLFIIDVIWGIGIINLYSLPNGWWLLFFVLSFQLLNIGYFMILEGRTGYSVGKSLVNITVQNNKGTHFIWRTFGAYGLDSILFAIFAVFCFGIGGSIAPDVTRHFTSLQYNDGSGQLIVVFFAVVIGVPFLVLVSYVLLETLFGASLGKKLMGLHVVQKI